MILSKKERSFEKELITSACLFKALAHPARLAILKYLAEMKTCMTGNIAEEMPLSRTTVNQHLKELKKVGLIKGTVEGVKTNYCINPDNVEWLKKTLQSFIEKIEPNDSKDINC